MTAQESILIGMGTSGATHRAERPGPSHLDARGGARLLHGHDLCTARTRRGDSRRLFTDHHLGGIAGHPRSVGRPRL